MYELIIKKVIEDLKKTKSIYSGDYPNIWCDFITQIQEQKFFNWYEYELFLKQSIHSELSNASVSEIEKMWESEVNEEGFDSPMKEAMIDELTDIICEKIYDEACDSYLEEEIKADFERESGVEY